MVVADAVLTMSRQFCKTLLQQGVMVATAAVLWWQPGLLTQLGLLLGAALLCARVGEPQAQGPQPSPAQPLSMRQPHWPTLLLFALAYNNLTRVHYPKRAAEPVPDAVALADVADTKCVAGCYRCVLSYYNQPDHPLIDRRDRAARALLLRLAAALDRRPAAVLERITLEAE